MLTIFSLSLFSASTCLADGCTFSAILTALSFGGNPRTWAILLGSCHALLLGVALWFAEGLNSHSDALSLTLALLVTSAAILHVFREQRHQGCEHRCCVEYQKKLSRLVAGGLPLVGVAFIVSLDSFWHGVLIHQAYPLLPPWERILLAVTSGALVGSVIGFGMSAGARGVAIMKSYSSVFGKPLLILLSLCWIWLAYSLGGHLVFPSSH